MSQNIGLPKKREDYDNRVSIVPNVTPVMGGLNICAQPSLRIMFHILRNHIKSLNKPSTLNL